MMAIKYLYWLLVLLTAATAAEYYVTVGENGSGCPGDAAACHNLSYYVNNTDKYFTDDTVFYFMEGTHVLDSKLQISDVVNITLQGYDTDASIRCINNETFIRIYSVENVEVLSLIFDSCKYVLLQNSWNITMSNLSILKNMLYGLGLINGYNVNINFCTFAGNSFLNLLLYYEPPIQCFSTLEQFNITIIDSRFASAGHGLQMNFYQGSSYEIHFLAQNLTFYDHQYNDIYAYVRDESIHSIKIDDSKQESFVFRGYAFPINTNCFHEYNNEIKTPVHILNSSFQTKRNNIYSIDIVLNHPIYVSEQDISFESCNVTNISIDSATVTLYNVLIADSTSSGLVARNSDAVTLHDVTITNNKLSGLMAYDSNIHIRGTSNVIANNMGINGGGMALYDPSLLLFYPPAVINFTNNTASKGGAIYWKGYRYCDSVIDAVIQNDSDPSYVHVMFDGNTASIGDDLYGISIALGCSDIYQGFQLIPFPSMSSDPTGVCTCNTTSGEVDCSKESFEVLGYPGQTITLPYVMVSDAINSINSAIVPSVTNGLLEERINDKSNIKQSEPECMEWKHIITTNSTLLPTYVMITLQVHDPLEPSTSASDNGPPHFDNKITLNITVRPCPLELGFELQEGVCACSESITDKVNDATCNIFNYQIKKQSEVWIGTHSNENCLVVAECPLDYCTSDSVQFTLNDIVDDQCRYKRSGTVCGQCAEGYSLVLGSNKCKQCSNSYIALVIPFALLGVALVVLLIVLNLTVAVGAINGLIFYANIVKLYESYFFPNEPIPLLSQFISWLNLDFGIETCFYNGMDSYGKVLLQYVFPLYIWCLIAFIIWLCRRYGRVSRLVGNNAVPVLATLLLLSYLKLFRTIGNTLHRTRLNLNCANKDEDIMMVWYLDPNVSYSNSWYLVLVIIACGVLLFLGLPYTIFLVFITFIEKYRHRCKCFGSLLWMKPIIDAYGSPYKDEYRFWTGILLVVRIILLIIISYTNSQVSLAVLVSLIVVVCTVAYSIGGPYNKRWLNALEAWFLSNTAVMGSLATIDESVAEAVAITSVSLVLLSFIVIVVYHICWVLHNTGVGKKAVSIVKNRYYHKDDNDLTGTDASNVPKSSNVSESRNVTRTSFVIQRESMIFNTTL